MARFLGALLVTALVCSSGGPARGQDDKDPRAILDKAIKALGGEEKLGTARAATWKIKGTIHFGGDANKFSGQSTVQGLTQSRQEFEGEFMGNKVKGVTVLNGDKAWRSFADMSMELDKEGVANEKRNLYLQLVPTLLVPLKGKEFKLQAAGEEKVDGKLAVSLKVTGPDGKDFRLYFDKASGLPVKQVAKVVGFMGEEFTQETTYGGYKDFDGINKATKVVAKRDGEKFLEAEITEFRILKKVDPKTFEEPK
jgi:hypothetical protein